MNWNEYFINLAKNIALKSKDPSSKVGCIIVDKNNRVISQGYNGFVSKCDESLMSFDRPIKYNLVIHAEMNALANAGRKISGCTAYLNYSPCENCAKTLLQFGIKRFVIRGEVKDQKTLDFVKEYLGESNVKVW